MHKNYAFNNKHVSITIYKKIFYLLLLNLCDEIKIQKKIRSVN